MGGNGHRRTGQTRFVLVHAGGDGTLPEHHRGSLPFVSCSWEWTVFSGRRKPENIGPGEPRGFSWHVNGVEVALILEIAIIGFILGGGGRYSLDRLIGREL